MKALQNFRDAVHAEAEGRPRPTLQVLLAREAAPVLHWRWAAAATVLVVIAAVPVYREAEQQRQRDADTLLMQQVDEALSRSAPRAFTALVMERN